MSEKSLGEKIKAVREERKWSREKLAMKLGVSSRTVLRWELKGVFPNDEDQEALIRHLGFQKEDFKRQLEVLEPKEDFKQQVQVSVQEVKISLTEPSGLEHILPPKEDFRLYCGRRIYKRNGNGHVSRNTYVTVNGRPLKYFGPWNRNPEKNNIFEWGYNGSGPRTLAQAILADYLGEIYPEQGYGNHSDYNALLYALYFKNDIIVKLPRYEEDENIDDSWQISSNQIREWFYSLEQEGITRDVLLEGVIE